MLLDVSKARNKEVPKESSWLLRVVLWRALDACDVPRTEEDGKSRVSWIARVRLGSFTKIEGAAARTCNSRHVLAMLTETNFRMGVVEGHECDGRRIILTLVVVNA